MIDSPVSLLFLEGVTVSFDGFKALNDLSLAIDKGEMRAIIGPNGAGKTTMMDVITGKTRPQNGTVQYDGKHDLRRLNEAAIANLGIGRKFQRPTVFESLTVRENLVLALKARRNVASVLFARETPAHRERIKELLALVRLDGLAQRPAALLSHGQKQWLEIGMLLAQDPQLLLVDEPVAGMTDAETAETGRLLREINRSHTIVVVEHDMEFVKSLDVRVNVLHEGSSLAEGSFEHVSRNDKVIDVYLGR